MVKTTAQDSPRTKRRGGVPGSGSWKLADAKACFGELVRRARSEGPQHVTVRGRGAVVVISADAFDRLMPREPRLPFVDFMESLHLDGLDLTRETDRSRDPDFVQSGQAS